MYNDLSYLIALLFRKLFAMHYKNNILQLCSQGGTPTGKTGPSSAFTGSYYKFAEATNRSPGDIASLESNIPFNGKRHLDTII